MAPTEGTGPLTTEELFRRHAGFVARFLARLGVPPDQLEDALQEVFLVAHRQGGYRPGPAKPTSYLASIAIHAAARHRRRDGAARGRHSEAAVDELAGERTDPARAAQVRQDLARLQRALDELPQELCTTLLLVELEGESCVSVAAALGCPVGTIYWRLHQARKELRAALEPRAAEREKRAQPARSWMILFAPFGFGSSEASRLLQLAREQPSQGAPLEQLLLRHHELVRAGAELPAWASALAPQSASWLALIGVGPIAAGITAAAVIAVVTVGVYPEAASMAEPQTERVLQVKPDDALALQAAAIPSPSAEASDVREEGATPVHAGGPLVTARHAKERAADGVGRRDPGSRSDPDSDPDSVPDPDSDPAPRASPAPRAPRPPLAPAPIAASAARMDRALTDAELAEMREIARAERLLADDPKRALALTRAMDAAFPETRFREERAYLEVMALFELERTSELRRKAAAFLRSYPAGLYSDRVRRAVAGR